MTVTQGLLLALSVAMFGFLVAALIKPEWF
ncbi:MAG: K(+)-transporting ATPase subunit F [Actinomycetota bacterium]|nr:K(+)-transporting ATPase subunit F [Actinomycetota bacterium]